MEQGFFLGKSRILNQKNHGQRERDREREREKRKEKRKEKREKRKEKINHFHFFIIVLDQVAALHSFFFNSFFIFL